MGVGTRLKQALQERGRTVQSIQRDLKERGVRGSAYSTVWRYLNEESGPSLDFIRAAAELLGVNQRWLETGEGSPNAPRDVRVVYSGEDELSEFRRGVTSAVGPRLSENRYATQAIADAARVVWISRFSSATEDQIGELVGSASINVLRELGLNPEAMLPEDLEDHLEAMAVLIKRLFRFPTGAYHRLQAGADGVR